VWCFSDLFDELLEEGWGDCGGDLRGEVEAVEGEAHHGEADDVELPFVGADALHPPRGQQVVLQRAQTHRQHHHQRELAQQIHASRSAKSTKTKHILAPYTKSNYFKTTKE